MGTFGKDACPFTGINFATVVVGNDDVVAVETPIFRKPVGLSLKLYHSLPKYEESEKLNFRRWIAYKIDLNEPVGTLVTRNIASISRYPEPSPDIKAYRLLGWMVAERARKGSFSQKFEFGAANVKPEHEALIVTESKDREELRDLLQRLQALGFIDFVDTAGRTVTEPGLTVRLTDVGTANAGQPPLSLLEHVGERKVADRQRFEDVIKTLVDGNDADRYALLQWIERHDIYEIDVLADRIRNRIRDDSASLHEGELAIRSRDPKTLASARSWMLSCLIRLEPDNADSRRLILEHLEQRNEPDDSVRFWTLAGIVKCRLSYMQVAVNRTIDDSSPAVSGLAAVAIQQTDDQTIARFRSDLRSRNFRSITYVLRILRIVAIAELVPDVVAQLGRVIRGRRLTYDALFALANPGMAELARPLILGGIGLQGVVQMMIEEARSSNSICISAFARVLAAFDQKEAFIAARAIAVSPEDRQLFRRIIDEVEAVSDEGEIPQPAIAGIVSDAIDIDKDDIGIAHDVEILASMILANEVTPPLAIGLFGEWGSGKSFFMKSIIATTGKIAERAKVENVRQFCSNIVQIEFNAWHYIDTSLWASLVDHILGELSKHLHPEPNSDIQQTSLVSQLASAKAEMAVAERERISATLNLAETAKNLHNKTVERQQRELELSELRAGDLFSILKNNEELKNELNKALEAVGAPAALESINDLNKSIGEIYSTAGRVTVLLNSIFSGRTLWVVIFGIVIIAISPLLASSLFESWMSAYFGNISSAIFQVTVIIGSVAAMTRQALAKAKVAMDAVSRAKRNVDNKLAERRAKPSTEEINLQNKLAESKANEQTAAEQYSAAADRAKHIEERIAEIEEARTVGYFIKSRVASDDYRKHLGLISTIRKDFDELVARLEYLANGEQQIDRIVLYIDDVDRCPPDMVVEILQAVHLLLAYKLFVVVVSVDPRWLLRSLETNFSQLRPRESVNAEAWAATPQDYLEKIFQIPYSVRPMGDRGFSKLMGRLLSPLDVSSGRSELASGLTMSANLRSGGLPDQATDDDEGAGPDGTAGADTHSDTPEADAANEAGPDQRFVVYTDSDAASHTHSATAGREISDDTLALEELVGSLTISEAETAFAQTLGVFLRTPRSAKRFANVYRLFKASLPRSDLPRFEGTSAVPGDFRLPMLLLAVLVGDPKSAAMLFPQFLARATKKHRDWWQPDSDEMENLGISTDALRICAELDKILGEELFAHAPALAIYWIPLIARYSFTTARLYLDVR